MKKKYFIYALLFVLAIVLLYGCIDGSNSGSWQKIVIENVDGDDTSRDGDDSTTDVGDEVTDEEDSTTDVSGDTGLPPDPGEEGKKTLEGIDSDNDDVRDDIKIAIYEKYPDDEEKRAMLEQSAKAFQAAVLADSSNDINAAHEAMVMISKAIDCMYKRGDDSSSERYFLKNKILDTPERDEAYQKFSESLSGQILSVETVDNPCE